MRKRYIKALIVVLLVTFVFSFTQDAFAQSAVRKLGRGLANTFTGFLELPQSVVDAAEDDGAIAALTYGITKGVAMSVLRTAVGIYETFTFLIPLPWKYEPILEPEFMMGDENY